MQKLTKKQQDILNVIISKRRNWNSNFDQLFIELIPYVYGVARKFDISCYQHFIEWDDFLTYAFIVYESLIRNYQANKDNNSKNFLTAYGVYLQRMFLYIIRRYNNRNGEKILSSMIPDDQIVGLEQSGSNLEKTSHINIDIDTFINGDALFKKTYNLLKSGCTVKEAAKKLNVSRSNLYNFISLKKAEFKKHHKIY